MTACLLNTTIIYKQVGVKMGTITFSHMDPFTVILNTTRPQNNTLCS